MKTVRKLLLAQLAGGLLVAAAAGFWRGAGPAGSALAGALIGVVPNAFLAARLLSPKAGASAGSLLRAGWIGAAGQLAISALLFAAAFVALRPLFPAWLFAGFIVGQLAWPLTLAAWPGRGTD